MKYVEMTLEQAKAFVNNDDKLDGNRCDECPLYDKVYESDDFKHDCDCAHVAFSAGLVIARAEKEEDTSARDDARTCCAQMSHSLLEMYNSLSDIEKIIFSSDMKIARIFKHKWGTK